MLSYFKRCESRIYPFSQSSDDCSEILTTQKRLVLTAPTGSGKSTQVPQMLLDSGLLGDGQVTVLQPRRLPTRMLAAWVAQARDVRLGAEVGYQMRLDNVTSPATRIVYATEGVLLRRMLADPDLKGVSAIVFDEFHERHLYGTSLWPALSNPESTRPDLIIVVHVNTLDVAANDLHLAGCCHPEAALILWPSNICPKLLVTRPSGNARLKSSNAWCGSIPKATLLCSCLGRMRSPARCRQRAVRSARSSWCFHCTANWRPEIRTLVAHDGAKSSSPLTSRKPRSPSTVFAW
jgi:hypothetical protein